MYYASEDLKLVSRLIYPKSIVTILEIIQVIFRGTRDYLDSKRPLVCSKGL